MTHEELIEGNRLIAQYMGWEHWLPNSDEYWNVPKGNIPLLKYSAYPLYDLRFHTSWDWLIPVCDRLYISIMLDLKLRDRMFLDPLAKITLMEWPHRGIDGKLSINGSWLKVVDLIKWYNKQINNNEQ